jgi:hypothetical protein
MKRKGTAKYYFIVPFALSYPLLHSNIHTDVHLLIILKLYSAFFPESSDASGNLK